MVKASNVKADQASNQSKAAIGQRSPGTGTVFKVIIREIKELKIISKGLLETGNETPWTRNNW